MNLIRRAFLAGLIAAPALVRADSLMVLPKRSDRGIPLWPNERCAQLVDYRRVSMEEIHRSFRVPPKYLGRIEL